MHHLQQPDVHMPRQAQQEDMSWCKTVHVKKMHISNEQCLPVLHQGRQWTDDDLR